MATINDIHMASGPNQDAYVPPCLRAGDGDFNTEPAIVLADEVLQQYEVVARVTATGKIVAWNPAVDPVDGSERAIGVTCYAVDATGADVEAAIYKSGYFNTDALVWPDGVTDAQKASAFDGTHIKHRKLV